MKYRCLTNQEFIYGDYQIVPLREQDIFHIKQWRNEQITVLRQKRLLTNEDQLRYYRNAVSPTFEVEQPSIVLFSYLLQNDCIGYGGLTNIDWESKRAEISFLLNTKRISDPDIYKKDFQSFLTLMKKVAFDELRWNRLFTETYDIRPHHIRILEESGFQFEGRMRQHVLIDGDWVDSLLHGCLKESWHA
ncbi:GNAT family N-acetyltransferase [Paenibacillus hexagrammi]|uniref:GNAT family N-acetyltransferase n=1 Tax=Paenibacillus hexagrammi TaxID=2908839 RepID=A0ABY3SHK6_9BACL|nr:GNAT family N-acetyltransferase [Paenibacillus sp. YPD9-1]UJF33199.1 GNAT family N-acetyltransferase [Paenibacillus sp. YPD9-1]